MRAVVIRYAECMAMTLPKGGGFVFLGFNSAKQTERVGTFVGTWI